MTNYVFRNGERLTARMLSSLNRLDADLRKKFGVSLIVTSGIRLNSEQKQIFLERYVTAANIRGRYVYDTRVWNGVRYYRISPAGTVAVPGTSDHEVQGNNAAVDIRDTGSDAGVTVRTSVRGRWLRENAWRYDMVADGDGFGESWHFRMVNVFAGESNDSSSGSSSGSSGGTINANGKEEDMFINIQGQVGKRNGGAYYIADNVATFIGPTVAGLPTLSTANADALAKRVRGI